MFDEETDVEQVDSSPTNEDNEGNDSGTPDQTEDSGTETPEGSTEVNQQVDERGVPVQNVHAEFDRKYGRLEEKVESLFNSIPEIIETSIGKANVAQPSQQQPQYTKEELIKFKNTTDDVSHKSWAELELEKIRQTETQQFLEASTRNQTDKQRKNYEQQNSQREVMRLFPSMFNKDGTWNNADPLTNRVARVYNSSKKFKDDPQGLLAASKIAYADSVMEQKPQTAQQLKDAKSQVKKLEKATMSEGGGVSQTPRGKSEVQLLQEQFAKTGRTEDLTAYLKAKFVASKS